MFSFRNIQEFQFKLIEMFSTRQFFGKDSFDSLFDSSFLFAPESALFRSNITLESFILKNGDSITLDGTYSDIFISVQPHSFNGNLYCQVSTQEGSAKTRKLLSGETFFVSRSQVRLFYNNAGGVRIYIWMIPEKMCSDYSIISINHQSSKIAISKKNISNVCWFSSFYTGTSVSAILSGEPKDMELVIIDDKSNRLIYPPYNNLLNLTRMNVIVLRYIGESSSLIIEQSSSFQVADWTNSVTLVDKTERETFLSVSNHVSSLLYLSFFGSILLVFGITTIILLSPILLLES